MYPINTFNVLPTLPKKLDSLLEIAYNIYWSWDPASIELFQRLARRSWESTNHNPVLMLGTIEQERLHEKLTDEGFMAHLERVTADLKKYLTEKTWFMKNYPNAKKLKFAYFSAEYGLTECLPIYSGGLGILAGDHLKAASDLGLPLVGVGLLYQQGYFRQYLNVAGWQQERYPENDFFNMPIRIEKDKDDKPLVLTVPIGDHDVSAQIWRVQVGRIPLYLLNTNIRENNSEDRLITSQLYGGDLEMRMKQEILLGMGGIRALDALGIEPNIFHMNEGHSAFLALERIRKLMKQESISYKEAHTATCAGNVFTTHTPVPAGIDIFPIEMMDKYFGKYRKEVGLSRDEFLDLGRFCNTEEEEETPFNMATMAIRHAAYCNGVSKLHGVVSRKMWQNAWPGVPEEELPITTVTNGTHVRSWVSHDIAQLFDRYLGPRWIEDPFDTEIWKLVEQIPPEELWRTHERRRERLIAFARKTLKHQIAQRGASPIEVSQADEVLDPDILTIGFARRFATYKRATLIFKDPQRLASILNNPQRPVQLIFAGKAHPKDNEGKEFIRDIIHFGHQSEFRRRIVFLEDYDMIISRYMVQGVDVWLNNPRRFREASGTSGMKASVNGCLNLSVLDGWWDEAYSPDIGWALGLGEEYEDFEYQDQVESNALYNLLEKEVVPLFYSRGLDRLPRQWISKMKASMSALIPVFSTDRMVKEYLERFYLTSGEKSRYLTENKNQAAMELSKWKAKVYEQWGKIKITNVFADIADTVKVGSKLAVKVDIQLGALQPQDVSVELYYGRINARREICDAKIVPLKSEAGNGNGHYTFNVSVSCVTSGRQGYTVRVLPNHKDLNNPLEMGLIHWK